MSTQVYEWPGHYEELTLEDPKLVPEETSVSNVVIIVIIAGLFAILVSLATICVVRCGGAFFKARDRRRTSSFSSIGSIELGYGPNLTDKPPSYEDIVKHSLDVPDPPTYHEAMTYVIQRSPTTGLQEIVLQPVTLQDDINCYTYTASAATVHAVPQHRRNSSKFITYTYDSSGNSHIT